MMNRPCDTIIKAYMPYLTGAHVSELGTVFPSFEASLIQQLISESILILKSVSILPKVSVPAVVVGDIHGNITDLIHILEKFADFQNTRYVFMGDYVDRGMHSVPVITLLLSLMCKYPSNFILIRGNHEFSHINQMYGFFDELMIMYQDVAIWDAFQEVFAWMPLGAIINDQVFCVHGGISPFLLDVRQIEFEISRPIYDYDNAPLIADLVWSDPASDTLTSHFAQNHRGSGVLFGNEALKNFLSNSNLKMIVRAHQCVADGYSIFSNTMGITVFSSSDYCQIIHNRCGVLKLSQKGKLEIFSFHRDSCFTMQPPNVVMTINSDAPGMRRSFKKTAGITLPQQMSITGGGNNGNGNGGNSGNCRNGNGNGNGNGGVGGNGRDNTRYMTPRKGGRQQMTAKRQITTPHLSPKLPPTAYGRVV